MFYTHTPHSVYHGIVIFHCMVSAVIFQLIFCHTFTSLWIGHILVFCSMDKVSYSQLYKGGKWFVHEVYFILSWFVWWCTGVLLFIMFISTKQRFSMISNVAWPSRCMKYWLVVHYNLETWIEWCNVGKMKLKCLSGLWSMDECDMQFLIHKYPNVAQEEACKQEVNMHRKWNCCILVPELCEGVTTQGEEFHRSENCWEFIVCMKDNPTRISCPRSSSKRLRFDLKTKACVEDPTCV